MDKCNRYRQVIQQVIQAYCQLSPSDESLQSLPIFDPIQDQYLLVRMGWEGQNRIKRTFIHLQLKNEKIWIEEDWTEDGIATDLLLAGVPREDIVLAFHPPALRQHTEFATA
jgi:hypothetical protein